MARIRTIKPEFPQSESVGRLSRDARLLFIQLWTIVDDDGRARAASRMLASLLYPYDDDAPGLMEGWLAELERAGCIRRYEVDGSHYLDIPKWLEHQKIDHPSKSRLPSFSGELAKPREASRSLAPDLGPRTKDQGEGESAREARDAPPAKPRVVNGSANRASRLLADFTVPDDWITEAERKRQDLRMPAVNLRAEAVQFVIYHTTKPEGAMSFDWRKSWLSWALKARASPGDAQQRPKFVPL